MASKVLLLIGTKKGAFIAESDASRASWSLKGPYCAAWPIHHVVGDAATGTIYAGGGNEWFGPAVWKTTDRGATWTHSSAGLAYAEGETPIKAVWSLARASDRLYAGVEPAGLFESADGGETWSHIKGLTDHPTRKEWQPGGGGLILHTIVPHPLDAKQIWVAVSTGGVFHTADGGKSWAPRNKGIRNDYLPEGQQYPEFGQCVHNVAMGAGNPDRLYQQNHCGMYRSDDGGKSWRSMEAGLPSSFGFPVASHPRDPETVYLVPLNGDVLGRFVPDAKAAVWRSRDGGGT
ncbi:MAG: exo-alpha-sialidase, partial [Hyphomicrobium sp.]